MKYFVFALHYDLVYNNQNSNGGYYNMTDSFYLNRMKEMVNEHYDDNDLYPDFSKATLKLELNNSCNHRCIFCFHSKSNGSGKFMDEDLLYRLLDEGKELGIPQLSFYNNGEPFLCQNLHKYVKYAKDIGYPYIFINTNGALATPERLKDIIDAGIDSIKFSINAATRETYKFIHGQDDFDRVLSHLEFLREYRDKTNSNCKVLCTYALTKYSEPELNIFKATIAPLLDEYVLTVAHDSGGELVKEHEDFGISDTSTNYQYKSNFSLPCHSLFDSIIVEHTGNLMACPDDFYGYLTTCNLHNMTLKEAWYNPKMVELRKKHISGEINNLLCDQCINKIDPSLVTPICSEYCRER